MKTNFLIIVTIFFTQLIWAQDSIKIEETKTQIFSFVPLNHADKVNGLTVGAGVGFDFTFGKDYKTLQKVNGLNLDINPVGFLIFCFYDPNRVISDSEITVLNGVNLSIAGHLRGVEHNGINISGYNYANKMNGVTFSFILNATNELNGVSLAFLGNSAKSGVGLSIATINSFDNYKGVQIGFINRVDSLNGFQIGLINTTKSTKGFQIGFWNKNAKRSLPIINF